jgi:hypothetical protein
MSNLEAPQLPGRLGIATAAVSAAKGDQAMLRQVLVIEDDDGIAGQINARLSLISCKVR